MTTDTRRRTSTLYHWGPFEADTEDGRLVGVTPSAADPDPSPLLRNIVDGAQHRVRVTQPMVRAGWLDGGPGSTERRGAEPFVPVSWDTVTRLLAGEVRRVYDEFGAPAVFAGAYGWGSPGAFHQPQNQLHRFLNLLGGYVDSVNSYSTGAADVILPHVIDAGMNLMRRNTTWPVLADNTELWLAFGGVPLKNTAVAYGGIYRHETRQALDRMAEREAEFVLVSPIRDDLPANVNAQWISINPGTDVAAMLGIAHTLVTEELHDQAFLDRYCTGFDRFERYLLGRDDGQPRSAEWAAGITGIPAGELRELARRLPGKRVMVSTTWSLQRTEYGEYKPWMGVVLAAMLGQIGLPGGGYGFGYGSAGSVGGAVPTTGAPRLPMGANGLRQFIPVARTADMLLNPGAPFDFDGSTYSYPDVRLLWWTGGNPFHHHQDLPKLRRALAKPETIVVNEPYWTAMARHADIVLPSTIPLERNDIGVPPNGGQLVAMHKAMEPLGESRSDYETFAALAEALGFGERFTEGRDEMAWLRYMWGEWLLLMEQKGEKAPTFDEFWEAGVFDRPATRERVVYMEDFRNDPERNRLRTPSGRIEVFSEVIAGFGYEEFPGYPAWVEPREWAGSERAASFPLMMVANNPKTRLHSQLDPGEYSRSSKVNGREPIRLHPDDASKRGIGEGDVVRVYNDRGAFLAGAVLSEDLRPGVVQVSTGAWYDPLDPSDPDSLCVHGNPNVVTLDAGSSPIAQSSVGQLALVQVERWEGEVPPIRVFDPPPMEIREGV